MANAHATTTRREPKTYFLSVSSLESTEIAQLRSKANNRSIEQFYNLSFVAYVEQLARHLDDTFIVAFSFIPEWRGIPSPNTGTEGDAQ